MKCIVLVTVVCLSGVLAAFNSNDIRCPPGYNYPGGNQVRANGTYCDRECGLEGLKENCPIKTFAPVNRLYCNDGYARDYNCVCVPLGNCPRCAYYYTN
ncbi:inducible metalloproteinase inhibitor protein-like [Ctenocephalides felis]|uniref:inducible metalloproteinase inhibitor protein-like n=1 Tax=Ctenocephalides felis TaxID=7515 RepID=UPI000E6E2C5B|nr:inducible metalloproteinase inhibitor protein-like [Ctenocephalides felis]